MADDERTTRTPQEARESLPAEDTERTAEDKADEAGMVKDKEMSRTSRDPEAHDEVPLGRRMGV